jgi:predicted peptidase
MHLILASAFAAQLAHPTTSGVHELTYRAPDGRTILYALSVPGGYDAARPAPLVLVLHSGGQRIRYYGSAFMRFLAEPALGDLRPLMIAPDCPTNSWADPAADQAVMALVQDTISSYAVDRRRILVTGFSLGGRGTWFMASHHADVFTAAIPMAAATGDAPVEGLATMPTYIIHSRADEVVPFAPAERVAKQLTALGRDVHFEALNDLGHYDMGRYVEALRRAGRWVAERWRQ